MLSYLSYPPTRNNRGILKHVQSLPPRHQHRLSVHSVQQWLESHKLLPSPVSQRSPHIYPYIKVDENKQIAYRRMVAGPGIRGIIANTHRVAISNHRLVSLTDGQVTFRWRDSAHHNEQKLLPLSLNEFLCRFLLHILPKGFVRIRNFGFLANRKRATLLPLCFQLLGSEQQPQAEQHASSTEDCPDLWRCPKCGGPMKVIERLTAAEIQLRSPPRISAAA